MEYKLFNLEELQNVFDNKQNPEELSKIMCTIINKQDVLTDDDEETEYLSKILERNWIKKIR